MASYFVRLAESCHKYIGLCLGLKMSTEEGPCPGCGSGLTTRAYPARGSRLDIALCKNCNWTGIVCGDHCGSYLMFQDGTYRCHSCGFTAFYGGSPKKLLVSRPSDGGGSELAPIECCSCGTEILEGDLILPHTMTPQVICKSCAKGCEDGLIPYK